MRTTNGRLVALSSAIVAAAATLTTAVHPSASQASQPDDPVLVSGIAPGTGRVVDVDLYVLPPSRSGAASGDARTLHQLDAAFTQEGGTYAVRADPAGVPAALRSGDGVVDFMVFSTDQDGQVWSVSFSARAVEVPTSARSSVVGATAWLDAGRSSSEISRDKVSATGLPVLRGPAAQRVARAIGEGDADDETVDVPAGHYAPVALPRARAGGDPGSCLRETYVGDKNVSTTIGTSYPIGKTRSWMTHDSSTRSESTLGVAVGYEGENGAVSFSRNGTRFTTGSWGGQWDPSGHARSYRIQVNYHHYILGKGCNGAVHFWRPHVETGGASTNRVGLSRPNWDHYCAPQPRKFVFYRDRSDGNAYEYGSAVKFRSLIGIDLSISRQYATNQRITYRFGTDRPHRLCGNNDYPALAGKLIDRYR